MSARIDPGLAAWVAPFARDLVSQTDFHVWVGLELLSLEAGRAEVGFAAQGGMMLRGGYVHGGVLNGLMEPPGLLALLGHMHEDETAVTVDIHLQHLRSVLAGERVILTGQLLRRGRNVAFCEVNARVGGTLCTTARITKAIQKAS